MGEKMKFSSWFKYRLRSKSGIYKYDNVPNKINTENVKNKKNISKLPKIVTIGGGSGTSSLLRGIKTYSPNITAIVTVSDDGGGSGVLRGDLGILPPGDIRNSILALANTEPVMEKLLNYRFTEGMLKGQSFGNLFLAAMDGVSKNFVEAVKRMSEVLAVTGKVLPITLENVSLNAKFKNGTIVTGESKIGKYMELGIGRIENLFLTPKDANPLREAIDAILQADIIILGPGSLYTSIIPNLLVKGVCSAIKKSTAPKVYICNAMTQPGETNNFLVSDHLNEVEKYSYKGIIDHIIVDNSLIPEDIINNYKEENSEPVIIDMNIYKNDVNVIRGNFINWNKGYIRHDSEKLVNIVIKIINNSKDTRNFKGQSTVI